MNVIIQINGREAIPIRALPFLSDRKTMSPDVVARALAGTEQNGRFLGLRAHRVEHGVVTPIAERWWQTGPCQKLDALSASISAEECPGEHETEDEYQNRHDRELAKWREKSPGLLPAGAFVFKDEFEQLYRNEFKFGYYHVKGDDGEWLSEPNHNKRIALDYSPFVDDPATATLVMAGFDSYDTPNAGSVSGNNNQAALSQVTHVDLHIQGQAPIAPTMATAQDTATPAPVRRGLETKEIAVVFDGVNGWSDKRWSQNLSASQWLHPARTALGSAGGASAVWNPLILAQLIHKRMKSAKEKERVMKSVRFRFNRSPVLEQWRGDFNEYFETHCTTD